MPVNRKAIEIQLYDLYDGGIQENACKAICCFDRQPISNESWQLFTDMLNTDIKYGAVNGWLEIFALYDIALQGVANRASDFAVLYATSRNQACQMSKAELIDYYETHCGKYAALTYNRERFWSHRPGWVAND